MSTVTRHPTFKDAALERAFERDGFVVVGGVDADRLTEAYAGLKGMMSPDTVDSPGQRSINVTYHCTFLERNRNYKQEVLELTRNALHTLADSLLTNHRIYQANLFVKPPGTGFVCPHQNLTTVDELEFTSVSLWCPIRDATEENGTIHVLRGSHRRFERFRNSNILWPWRHLFPHNLSHGMEPVKVRAGEMLVLNDSIVHGSPDNRSAHDRVVFHALAAPESADLVYVLPGEDRVHLHRVDDTFWQEHHPDSVPGLGSLLRSEPWSPAERTEQQLAHELA